MEKREDAQKKQQTHFPDPKCQPKGIYWAVNAATFEQRQKHRDNCAEKFKELGLIKQD